MPQRSNSRYQQASQSGGDIAVSCYLVSDVLSVAAADDAERAIDDGEIGNVSGRMPPDRAGAGEIDAILRSNAAGL